MRTGKTPTIGLLLGLAVTVTAVGAYSIYTVAQLRSLRQLQVDTINRNRADSLLLLRIQNSLNSVSVALRDMLDSTEPYPLSAWRSQFERLRYDVTDAVAKESNLSRATTQQRHYFTTSLTQFWDALDRIFQLADAGQDAEARTLIRLSLQARQAALTTAVARLLVQNAESDQQAAERAQQIYTGAERNVYLFVAVMLSLIAATGLIAVQWNRRMFAREAEVSERRSELVRQLISVQENTFRHISRELHDEFGQVLTAVGAMLQRAGRQAPNVRADLEEVGEIVQGTLEKIRALSRALHPVVLDDMGFEDAVAQFVTGFEKQTSIQVSYAKEGSSRPIERDVAIHLYRILQEALNNVARHAKSASASVHLQFRRDDLVLEVRDEGVGFGDAPRRSGIGLTSMRERAELLHGRLDLLTPLDGGSLVRLTVPLVPEELHAAV